MKHRDIDEESLPPVLEVEILIYWNSGWRNNLP